MHSFPPDLNTSLIMASDSALRPASFLASSHVFPVCAARSHFTQKTNGLSESLLILHLVHLMTFYEYVYAYARVCERERERERKRGRETERHISA